MPKISVIIPVYNVERYLPECLDSILGQTLGDIEVLCVDDGSSDRSLAILNGYAAKDGRMRVMRASHGGAYRARELAFEEAKGEYVHFMDSDDVLDTHAFEECYQLCERENLDHLVFTTESFTSEGNPELLARLKKGFGTYYRLDDAICGMVMSGPELMGKMMETGRFFVSPPLRLMRLSTLKAQSIPSPHALYHGDNYYTAVSLYLASRAMAVNKRYYRRRVHGASITTAKGKESVHFASILNVIVALCRFAPFRERAKVPGSQEEVYLMELVGSMARRSAGVSLAVMHEAIAQVDPPLEPEMKAFLQMCFLPLFAKMRDSRNQKCLIDPTVRSCARYLVKRLGEKLRAAVGSLFR